MSLILDALNKSDRDAKDYGAAPGIDAHHARTHTNDKTKNILLAVIAGLIFVAIVLLAALVFKSPSQRASNEPMPPEHTAAVPASPPTGITPLPQQQEKTVSLNGVPAINRRAIESPGANNASESTQAVAELYATEVEEEEIPIVQPKVKSISTQEDEALAKFLWEQTKLQEPPEIPAQAEPQAQQPAAASAPTTAEQKPAEGVEHSIHHQTDTPFLHLLPVTLQNTIPTLMYADHQYSEGYVIINKKKRFVGDEAAKGVTLEEMFEDGATFSFNGTRFKLGALSSWVNY